MNFSPNLFSELAEATREVPIGIPHMFHVFSESPATPEFPRPPLLWTFDMFHVFAKPLLL